MFYERQEKHLSMENYEHFESAVWHTGCFCLFVFLYLIKVTPIPPASSSQIKSKRHSTAWRWKQTNVSRRVTPKPPFAQFLVEIFHFYSSSQFSVKTKKTELGRAALLAVVVINCWVNQNSEFMSCQDKKHQNTSANLRDERLSHPLIWGGNCPPLNRHNEGFSLSDYVSVII